MSKSINDLVTSLVTSLIDDKSIINYQQGIFFDNEQKYIDNVKAAFSEMIICNKVNETNYKKWDWNNEISDEDFKKNFIDKNNLQDNALYKLLEKLQSEDKDKDKYPYYDPKLRCDIDSGLNSESENQLNDWIKNNEPSEKCCALFDWDRTISQIEFMWSRGNKYNYDKEFQKIGYFNHPLFEEHKIDNTITDEDYLKFLCGGNTRLELIRRMMDKCKEKNIDIIILTNNINCSLISNECIVLFNALVGEITSPSTSKIRIICASETDPRFDKVAAIRTKCNFIKEQKKAVAGGGKYKKNKVKSKKNKVNSKKNKSKSKKNKSKF